MLFPFKFYFKRVYEPCLTARKHSVQCTVKNCDQTARRTAQREVRLKERISNQVIQNPGFLEMTWGVLWDAGKFRSLQWHHGSPPILLLSQTLQAPWYTVMGVAGPHPKDTCKHTHSMGFLDNLPPNWSFPPSPATCQCSLPKIPHKQPSLLAWSSPAGTSVFSFYRK